MSFFRRLFSAEYRRAVSAEAAGDFMTAARSYALFGDKLKVAQMHLAQAGIEEKLDGRIRALNTAVGFAPQGAVRADVLRQLGEALVERARSSGVTTTEGRRSMREAATRFEDGGWDERCGDCWLELSERDHAATAYSRAGMVEKVEQILSAEEEAQTRQRLEESSFKDFELLLQGGQRNEALAALRRCIDAARRKGEYRRLLADVEQRLLGGGRLVLTVGSRRLMLVGTFPLLLGRDPECQLQVRGQSVSRRHARILPCPAGGFTLEDAGSHNGTLLGGLPIGAPMPLPPSGTIGLGDSCVVEFSLGGDPPSTVRLVVQSGLDAGKLLVAGADQHDISSIIDDAPPLLVWFEGGHPMARPRNGLLQLNGARTGGPVQLIQNDVVLVGERPVKVAG